MMKSAVLKPDLKSYDVIVLNSSAGKDSQAMIDYVFGEALKQGVTDRLLVVHADLGKVEWKGTKELAERQAAAYQIPFMVANYVGKYGDFLGYIEGRGKFPDSKNRWCTSDFKRGPILKVITKLVADAQVRLSKKRIRVLNVLGLRAEESCFRAKKEELKFDKSASNGKRTVTTWLPILSWKTADVWDTIHESGVEYHAAYDLGMPRLSCCFCVFAPKDALVIAGQANPELLAEYIAVEDRIGHTFKNGFAIAEVAKLIDSGYQPKIAESWSM